MSFLKTDPSKAGGFQPIKPGNYECVISKVEVTTAQSSGNPMMKVELTVRNGVEQEFKGRKLFDNLAVTEKAMFKFHNLSHALEGDEFESLEQFAKFIKNKFVRVVVINKNETYQGETTLRDRISSYKKTEHPGGADSDEAGAFDEVVEDRGSDINDDDLPF